MIVVIDNYDSFTYNLVQYLGELGARIKIFRNDKVSLDHLRSIRPAKIVISPGPCTPREAGISNDVIRAFYREHSDIGCLPRGINVLAMFLGVSFLVRAA